MSNRLCSGCGRIITVCNGFVKAGDILEGRSEIRELCGACASKYEWNDKGELIRHK